MASTLSIAVKSYPHTTFLTEPGFGLDGHDIQLAAADPIYKAFAPMVRDLRYDVSELAIATFLQAREAGVPIALLPVVLSGDFHHHSSPAGPGRPRSAPRTWSAAGSAYGPTARRRACGSAASCTRSSASTPRTSPGSPPRSRTSRATSSRPTSSARRKGAGRAGARRRGRRRAGPAGAGRRPGTAGAGHPELARGRGSLGRPARTVPINHVLTVRRDLLEAEPRTVAALYQAFGAHLEARRRPTPRPGPACAPCGSG
ncbi:hypothetical protein NKH77_05345 [Streptomyces sp. M19]